MATKKDELVGIVHPANLWGKVLPRSLSRPTKDEQEEKMIHDEEDDDVPLTDVRAELDSLDGPSDDELVDEDEVEGDDFAPEAGDEEEFTAVAEDDSEQEEDEESESETVGAAVAAEDDEDVAPKATRTKKGTAMADTKKSISDHVRAEIEKRMESGDSLRGVDIVNALAARKITVSPAQVSQLLKKAGVKPKARGERKTKVAATATEGKSRITGKATPRTSGDEKPSRVLPKRAQKTEGGLNLPMAQLQAAEEFVTACGGLKQAERILTLAAQIAE